MLTGLVVERQVPFVISVTWMKARRIVAPTCEDMDTRQSGHCSDLCDDAVQIGRKMDRPRWRVAQPGVIVPQ